jgi:uncharacterized BrkB/YihY/UPF0761 family membrane protein
METSLDHAKGSDKLMLTLSFIVGFIGVAIALLIAILIFSEINSTIDSVIEKQIEPIEVIDQQKESSYWSVIGVLPIALFFILFIVFRFIGDGFNPFRKMPKLKVYLLELLCLIGLAKKEYQGGK